MGKYGFIKKYQVFIFYLITFAISWGGIILVVGMEGFLGNSHISEKMMPLLYSSTLAGPSVAGVLMMGLVNGKEGFRASGNRFFSGRLYWYGIALIIAPLLYLITLAVLMIFSESFLPGIFATKNSMPILIAGIIAGLLVGIFEELGWTFFVIPQLRKGYGVLKTGLIVGILWGLWHMPLFITSVRASEDISPVLFLCILLFSFLPAYRVLMVWIYDRTQSIAIAMLMHAGLTGSILILPPLDAKPMQVAIYDLLFALILWILVAVMTIINRGKLTVTR